MKLLVDMNLSPRWVRTLANAGIESTHWSTIGAANASDAAIMEFARPNDYVVFTHDLDFGAILASSHGANPSVVQIRSGDVSPESVSGAVISALRQMAPQLEQGEIDPARARVRVLPLPPT